MKSPDDPTTVNRRKYARRLLTGFLFSSTGTLIALSPPGKESCAIRTPINRAVWSDPQSLSDLLEKIPLQQILEVDEVARMVVVLVSEVAPHLDNHGAGNTGWSGDYKGQPMLFAKRNGSALALVCSAAFGECSVGFVGSSDGWQDLFAHRRLTAQYQRAENGNLGLTGEIRLNECGGEFILALGFGTSPAEAGHRARASLLKGFPAARNRLVRASTAVLRCHEAKRFPGGQIASLSIPWGASKGDEDLGGYHLVWPRDLVESAGGLLAAGADEDVRRILRYLQTTQEADGHWLQNMWMDGSSYWHGVQMDETALPILLVDLARREEALSAEELTALWPMVQSAAGFLVCNGPVTPPDLCEASSPLSGFVAIKNRPPGESNEPAH